jgi:hypothetical protein
LITSTDNDFATTGDNSAPIGGLTFTPSASQIAISGLSQVITTGTNYFLVVDIDPAVTGATSNIQPSLGASNVIVSSGGTSGSAVGTNYSFSVATLTFTEITPGTAPVMNGTILGAGSTLQVLTGFMVTSNGTQQATSIGFNYTGLSGQISPNEYLYRSSTAGAIGSLVATDNTPDGTFISLSETIDTTPAYFYLVVDISNSVTQATGSLTVAPTEANVTVTSGNKNAFSINRVFTFGTSQQSNIIFTVSASSPLNYRNIQLAAIHDTDLSKSHRLGTFQVQDGGGAADSDNKATSITSIRIQISNFANIRTVALFDDDAGPSEISGTETPINGVGTGIITFTPTNPIRTASDGGVFNFIVRATFMSAVTDNQAMIVTIDSVVSENGYSGFASPNAGGANSSSGTNHSILVTATKLILSPGVSPTTQGVGGTFGFTIKAVDGKSGRNCQRWSWVTGRRWSKNTQLGHLCSCRRVN